MVKQLIQQSWKWIVDTEDDAVALIEEYKDKANKEGYFVKKGNYTAKVQKSKGEIVGITYIVEIVVTYD